MPIVVVGAIAAGAAVSVGVAVSTVAMVGLGASVVGKITKSKELMQLGAGIGLGAGVASVATGAFGAATSATAGTAEAGTAALENTISSADLAGIDAAAGGIGGSTPGALSISTAWDAPATAIEAAGSNASSAGGLLGSAPVSSTVPGQQAAVNAAAPAPAAPASTVNSPVAPPAGTDSNSIKQWWAKQPESVKNKILQVGGSAVGGLFDGWSAEQKLALQREQQNLEKQKYDTMMANGSAQPVVKFQQYKPATGLLGSTKG